MFTKKKVKKVSDERKNKILKWIRGQNKTPTYERWDATTMRTLYRWQNGEEFGNEIRMMARSLYLKYFVALCEIRCIQKYGKKNGREILNRRKDKLDEIKNFCDMTSFYAKNI
jgi:hypothetical protein